MGIGRYELSDAQWGKIEDFLPGRKEHVGRTAKDNRLFVNGVLWVLRSGARWQDLPPRYGKHKSAHKRFSRWAKSGVWEKVFHALPGDRKNQYPMIDSTIVRAHQQAATGRKKGDPTRLWGVPEEA
jgi:putative transposase